MSKPDLRPARPFFSSGPCAKRPGWSVNVLENALVGRSHRSGPGKERLKEVIERHRALLGIPADYRIAIVPASDTGAVEMALWGMLGARGVDVLAWESFSRDWMSDIVDHLAIEDVRTLTADYGEIPDLGEVSPERDVVFAWNGTTSGVRVPNLDWISGTREGLTFCDATSAVFAYEMEWDRLDVTTWSWQKVLGGEAQHGMLVLSPRAAARLESYSPPRPVPKIFRLTRKGRLIEGAFAGETLNTPSMLAVEDCLDALKWVEDIGGRAETIRRSEANLAAIAEWAAARDWIDFLPVRPEIRSRTSICLKFTDPAIAALDKDAQAALIKDRIVKPLSKEGVAEDIAAYRAAPPGLRIWGGATVERDDIEALLPWIDWAHAQLSAQNLSLAG